MKILHMGHTKRKKTKFLRTSKSLENSSEVFAVILNDNCSLISVIATKRFLTETSSSTTLILIQSSLYL